MRRLHGTAARPEHLFVVRMWQEPGASASALWRGSVQHVPSGERAYFMQLADLNEFIRGQLARPSESANQRINESANQIE